MVRKFLFAITVLISGELFAQDSTEIFFNYNDTVGKTYIDIGAPYTDELITTKIGFNGIRFIDNRIDTSSIGYVCADRFYKVNFKNNLAFEFNNYVESNFKQNLTQGEDSLLIIIDNFRISPTSTEIPDGKEVQFVKIKLLCAKKNKNQISVLRIYDTLLFYKRKTHERTRVDCIRKMLRNIILNANELALEKSGPYEELTKTEFFKKYVNQARGMFFKDSGIKKGVYTSFEEAMTNSPKYKDYQLKYKNYYYIEVSDNNGKRINWEDIWGYSDGKTIYVYAKSTEIFYPLIKEGNSLTISLKSANPQADKKSSQVANGFLLSFSVLTHTASGPAAYGVVPPKIYQKFGTKKYEMEAGGINMQTGEIDF